MGLQVCVCHSAPWPIAKQKHTHTHLTSHAGAHVTRVRLAALCALARNRSAFEHLNRCAQRGFVFVCAPRFVPSEISTAEQIEIERERESFPITPARFEWVMPRRLMSTANLLSRLLRSQHCVNTTFCCSSDVSCVCALFFFLE